MGDFHKYYSEVKRAPVLTLVIGGNHEASNYFSELYYGGWLAPNIYYLGAANVLRYGPFRIAGISGIYKRADYHKPHHERLPYDGNEVRSVCHIRECDIAKLLQVRSPVDIGLSHDWPRRMEWFGDYKKLFADRPTFLESAKIDNLGSAPAEQVMNVLRPRHWFSGHMHIKYTAVVEHRETIAEDIFKDIEVSDELRAQLPKSMFRAAFGKNRRASRSPPPNVTNTVTSFLGLNKPGPGREYLELLELDSCFGSRGTSTNPYYMQTTSEGKYMLHYDDEWLSIIRSSAAKPDAIDTFLDLDGTLGKPGAGGTNTGSQNLTWIQNNIIARGLLKIPDNFERHAPIYNPGNKSAAKEHPGEFPNSQTEEFCKMLQIPTPFWVGEQVADEDYIVFE
jgi:lariat debranching enzyme